MKQPKNVLSDTENGHLMTSEFLFLGGSRRIKEFMRRMAILDLSKEQIRELIKQEKTILKQPFLIKTSRPLAAMVLITTDTNLDKLPRPNNLSASELVMIVLDVLMYVDSARQEIPLFKPPKELIDIYNADGSYQKELIGRFGRIGLSLDKVNLFIRNEVSVVRDTKHETRSAWRK